VVVSDRFARSAGVPVDALIGRTLVIGNATAAIVGVMPRSFAIPSEDTLG
jgi:branched-subunit amino acid ABC-type transport system permease component